MKQNLECVTRETIAREQKILERANKFRRWEKNCEKYRTKCQYWSGILIGYCIAMWCDIWANLTVTLIVYFVLLSCAFYRVWQYGRAIETGVE
ncbi:MAG: hypothetical protein IJU89_01340 [Alphaproteobacteria bacterium]|nr:hypothetical protein [Alphaproteobacteria bacterium]